MGTMRLAAVQAAPEFLNLAASVDKACRLIREAGAAGAAVVGFPEGFIPAHPVWYHFHPDSSQKALSFAKRLSENAVEIPGPAVDALAAAAKEAGVFVVMGCCERVKDRPGTLYNTLIFIDSNGQVVGRHRKLVPTLGERLVHAPGDALGLKVYTSTKGARISGLMCGENSSALANFVLDALGTNIHVASWPSHFNVGVNMREIIPMVTRALAYQSKAFVINAIGNVSEQMFDELPLTDEHREFLQEQQGGACIAGMWGKLVAGPMDPGEGILYGDVDLEDLTVPNLIQDFGGHYNRFDLLKVEVNPGRYDSIRTLTSEIQGESREAIDMGTWSAYAQPQLSRYGQPQLTMRDSISGDV
jgi:nitrilase